MLIQAHESALAIASNAQLLIYNFESQITVDESSLYITVNLDGSQQRPTYHGVSHTGQVDWATNEVICAYLRRSPEDLFGLHSQIERWKALHAHEFDQDLLNEFFEKGYWKIGFQIFAAAHDLGNITHAHGLNEQGGLDYAERHVVKGAEARSADITDELMDIHFEDEHPYYEVMKAFVRHLIMQTVFDPKANPYDKKYNPDGNEMPPFWEVIQVADQIGSNYSFGGMLYGRIVMGYLNELHAKGIQSDKSLKYFVDFVNHRLEQLVPDPERRRQMLKIFNRDGMGVTKPALEEFQLDKTVNFERDIPLIAEALEKAA